MTLAIISPKRERRYRKPVGQLSTTFNLSTTAAAATYPFSMGMFFRKGDVPDSIQCSDLVGYQVVPKRTWSDGSLKHCIISGRVALQTSVAKTITITNGTAPSGTDLTAADIVTAAPTATFITGGATVQAQLADLLASPIRTWVSGPEMVECHYYTQSVTSQLIAIWFHVRLFADGRMWVRCIVENGKLDNGSGALFGNANSSYIPTIVIGGVNVYTNGGATLTHYAHTRYSAEGWINGNPLVTPSHNPSYMDTTRLVPHYYWRSPSAAKLNSLIQTYTPMSSGGIPAGMFAAGFQQHIGILPNWDALYATTGDARAFRSMLANSSHVNSYGIVWRDFTTHLPPKPSTFPTWSFFGPGGGGTSNIVTGPTTADMAHFPAAGYFAYLCTGDYWHYETLALSASFMYLFNGSGRGSGVNRRINGNQTRAIGWGHRTTGQYAAVAPDGDAVAEDYRTMLANDYVYLRSLSTQVSASPIGYLVVMSTYNAAAPLTMAPFEQHFMIQSIGHVWDIEPGFTSTVAHQAVRDFMYRAIVGILGANGAENYCFTRAGIANDNDTFPNMEISAVTGSPFFISGVTCEQFYDTWGEIWTNTFGFNNTACANTLEFDGSNAGGEGYFANLLPAIGYAVDHEAPGASAAFTRLSGATNWAFHVAGAGDSLENYHNLPVFGIPPRTYTGV